MNLTRRPRKTRRHIQRGIFSEEIPGPQQQGHGLRGHDGVILRAGEMGDAKGVPEDDVGVGDVGAGVGGDPFGKAARGVAGGLRDVAPGGVDL